MRIKAGRIVISYHLSLLGIIQLCLTYNVVFKKKKIAFKVSFNNKYKEMIKKKMLERLGSRKRTKKKIFV